MIGISSPAVHYHLSGLCYLRAQYCIITMSDQGAAKLFERLPKTVVPTHYDLTIQPFLDTFKFNGNVVIHLKV